jgi:hypothetical protein
MVDFTSQPRGMTVKENIEITTKIQWKPVQGQKYSNRARYHLCRIMLERGYSMRDGLDCITSRALYNFTRYGSDITLNRLTRIVDEIGITLGTVLRPYPGEEE